LRPVQHTWVITGNNISYSGEMARRVVPSYLNAHSETPQLGRVFKHANIRSWATRKRGELIWAALVLIQRWIAKGKPMIRINKVLGMFEAWSEIMANILSLAGITGFLDNLNEFYDEAIQEEHDSAPFVQAWWETHGEQEVTAAMLTDLAHKHLELEKPMGGISVKPTSKKVGWFLKKIKKRVYVGLEIVPMEKKAGRPDRYKLVPIKGVAVVEVSTGDVSAEVIVGQNGLNWL
jgi:putative DNA primase/helicase